MNHNTIKAQIYTIAFWYSAESILFNSWSLGVMRSHNRVKHIYICFNGDNLWKSLQETTEPRKVQIYLQGDLMAIKKSNFACVYMQNISQYNPRSDEVRRIEASELDSQTAGDLDWLACVPIPLTDLHSGASLCVHIPGSLSALGCWKWGFRINHQLTATSGFRGSRDAEERSWRRNREEESRRSSRGVWQNTPGWRMIIEYFLIIYFNPILK